MRRKALLRIASVFLFLFYMQYIVAQTDTVAYEQSLNEVQISASRITMSYAKTGRVISIIDKQQLQGLQVQSVQDVLDYVSGVDLRQRGVDGIQADVSIRGGSFDQVMILLNGINVTDPQTGHLSMNLPIDFSAIERIEIMEGPGARVLGPNAFSGAINFVTGISDENQVMLQQNLGQYGYNKTSASIKAQKGILKSFGAVNYSKSDGYRQNTDFEQYSLFYQAKLEKGKERVEFQTGYLNKSFGAFAFYTPKYPNQYEQNRTLFSSLKYNHTGSFIKISPSFYWRRNHDRFELFRSDAPAWYTTHNYHLTDVYGASVNATIQSMLGVTAIGGEVRSEAIWSNNIGNAIDNPLEVPGEKGHYFNKFYQRSNQSIFIEHTYSLQALTVSMGVLVNRNTGFDFKAKYFPGIDVSYWLKDGVKVYGSVNKSFRLPSFTDLYYVTSLATGNKNLKSEEVIGYEAGIKFYQNAFELQTNYFYRDATNLIDWGRTSIDTKYQSMNISSMKSMGAQFSFKLKSGVFPLIRQMSVDYMYLTQNRSADKSFDSYYVMDYLKHNAVVRVEHGIVLKLSGAVAVRYQDRKGSYTNAVNENIDFTPVWLTDYQLNWIEKAATFYVGVNNLFDKQIVDVGNIPQPGRWVRGGIILKFGI